MGFLEKMSSRRREIQRGIHGLLSTLRFAADINTRERWERGACNCCGSRYLKSTINYPPNPSARIGLCPQCTWALERSACPNPKCDAVAKEWCEGELMFLHTGRVIGYVDRCVESFENASNSQTARELKAARGVIDRLERELERRPAPEPDWENQSGGK